MDFINEGVSLHCFVRFIESQEILHLILANLLGVLVPIVCMQHLATHQAFKTIDQCDRNGYQSNKCSYRSADDGHIFDYFYGSGRPQEYTAEADAVGTLRILEAVRILGLEKKTRLYQASTSELFGLVQEVPQRETTPFYPRSPYGVAKQYGFWITKNYRESYGMFAVNGILFNHESERRGETFVTRKITLAAARIAQGFQDKLYLGNLNALRDWGYAKDYVECMWLMLQHDTPEDFVIATGEYHSVREFCTLAFREAGIELRWEGSGIEEKGIDVQTGRTLVEVDPKYFRPAEVEQLLGDPTKAKTLLGWNPQQTSFEELVRIMVRHDMRFVKKLYLKSKVED